MGNSSLKVTPIVRTLDPNLRIRSATGHGLILGDRRPDVLIRTRPDLIAARGRHPATTDAHFVSIPAARRRHGCAATSLVRGRVIQCDGVVVVTRVLFEPGGCEPLFNVRQLQRWVRQLRPKRRYASTAHACQEETTMERKHASDFPAEVLKLFDGYVHGWIGRREFLDRASKYAVGGFTAAAMLESLRP